MCGISLFFARESIPDINVFDILFTGSEQRGADGFGIAICDRFTKTAKTYYSVKKYSECKDDALRFVKETFKFGNILIQISRATPETESSSTLSNLQPIYNNNCVLAHNGDVSNNIHVEMMKWAKECGQYTFNTKIDSESILAAYFKHGKNIKDCMEYVSGGFATIMYDLDKNRLYAISDFKPLAHCYIRGIGYFLHSSNDVLTEVLKEIRNITRDGMNMWEDWYHHYLDGNHILEIDIDSGFMTNIPYSPRYIIGSQWDSNYDKTGNKKV